MKEHSVNDFSRVLDSAFGENKYPLQLTGDLDDLLYSMDAVANEIRDLIAKGSDHDRHAVKKVLFGLRVKLQEDLPMIFKDVIAGIDKAIGPMEA